MCLNKEERNENILYIKNMVTKQIHFILPRIIYAIKKIRVTIEGLKEIKINIRRNEAVNNFNEN